MPGTDQQPTGTAPTTAPEQNQPTPLLQTLLRQKLPRGANSLPKDVVEAEQKKRLAAATAKVVAAKGYANTTVADIIAAAGVSRTTFYALFSDKEECFLFGFAKLSNAHLREVRGAFKKSLPLPERLRAAILAYMRRIDADRELALAFVIEAESATPQSRLEILKVRRRLQRGLRNWLNEVHETYPDVAGSTPDDLLLVTGGLISYVHHHVRSGEPFSERQLDAVLRFIFAAFHLYEWANHLLLKSTLRAPT
ncbi:TetR/AcrR family transcriptional regulator [Burkholderia cepacia]|uniref:TetR/AcrR family transcriptional regulator n=1 Tax=Burkholderia cepacia TaxID=292 RepID=UPI00075C81D1|nr:TetR/AcrR family transcriptional regulator [Burkholderia cepacia]KVW77451.1 hypothetical protein WL00_35955 [Burkholderia cepacia]KVX65662.1 hypothetical protein WL07_28205 [Burkholderia cepacia]